MSLLCGRPPAPARVRPRPRTESVAFAHAAASGGTGAPTNKPGPNRAVRTSDRRRQLSRAARGIRVDQRSCTDADDAAGRYRLTGGGYSAGVDYGWASAAGFEPDYRFISAAQAAVQDFRLYPIERTTAGQAVRVTVDPGDTLCVNNVQDSPGLGPSYVCRTIRVLAPSDGMLTIEAVASDGGERPLIEVETTNATVCCNERLEYPTSLQVNAGTEIRVSVELPWGSTASRSFVVNTSLR